MFNISIKETIKRLLPVEHRQTKFIAFLFRLLVRIRKVKFNFSILQQQLDYDIQFSSQTLSLENRLNQHYNLVLGTIYIETIQKQETGFLFWLNEGQAVSYDYWKSELQTPDYDFWQSQLQVTASADFIVFVPATLQFDIEEMKAIVNMYKLASKRFIVQPY